MLGQLVRYLLGTYFSFVYRGAMMRVLNLTPTQRKYKLTMLGYKLELDTPNEQVFTRGDGTAVRFKTVKG